MKTKNQALRKSTFKNVIVAAFILVSTTIFAQQPTKPEKWDNQENRGQMSPEQRGKAILEKLTAELKLNANQQEQVKQILTEQANKMKALKQEANGVRLKDMSKEDRKAAMQKRKEEKTETDNKLKAILTPEQFEKMKALEAERKEKMRAFRQERQGQE